MDTTDLFKELDERKIKLRIEDGFIGYKCPKGAMTNELNQSIRDNRDEVVAEIERRSNILGKS